MKAHMCKIILDYEAISCLWVVTRMVYRLLGIGSRPRSAKNVSTVSIADLSFSFLLYKMNTGFIA